MRGDFEDAGLESRFITEEMDGRGLRTDIPINLPLSFRDEALALRNKLLMYRFQNWGRYVPSEKLVDRSIEPRLNQIFVPLLSIIDDENALKEVRNFARDYNRKKHRA